MQEKLILTLAIVTKTVKYKVEAEVHSLTMF